MSDNPKDPYTRWIGAYYDGELSSPLRAELEAHLPTCAVCRAELAGLRALGGLLAYEAIGEPQPGAPHLSDREFAQAVLDRLPEVKPKSRLRWLGILYRLAPLAVFAAWAFLQAATWVGGLALIGRPPLDLARLVTEIMLTQPVELPGAVLPLAALVAANLWLTFNLALLLGGWLAGWFAYQKRQRQLV